jgi:hypothetical protein
MADRHRSETFELESEVETQEWGIHEEWGEVRILGIVAGEKGDTLYRVQLAEGGTIRYANPRKIELLSPVGDER